MGGPNYQNLPPREGGCPKSRAIREALLRRETKVKPDGRRRKGPRGLNHTWHADPEKDSYHFTRCPRCGLRREHGTWGAKYLIDGQWSRVYSWNEKIPVRCPGEPIEVTQMAEKTDKPRTYWENNGELQEDYERLWEALVPERGPASTRAGELLRCMSKVYHDRHNNGWCNLDFPHMQGAAFWWLYQNGEDLRRCLGKNDRALELAREGAKRAARGNILPDTAPALDRALELLVTATVKLAKELHEQAQA